LGVDFVPVGRHAAYPLAYPHLAAAVFVCSPPRASGPDIIGGLRHRGDRTPTLLLTARDAIHDRVTGLDCGADDYVVKPVHLDELAARMRALLRRAASNAGPTLEIGELQIDPVMHAVSLRGEPLDLSAREYALLEVLAARPGRALSRAQLEEALYGWGEEVASNAIEVHIHHLRRKLGPGWIRTLRGVGYALYPPAAGAPA
jgi:two-component system response regulator QseB